MPRILISSVQKEFAAGGLGIGTEKPVKPEAGTVLAMATPGSEQSLSVSICVHLWL
jgi:co-chaperonin GroES (HSP10)